jgi:lysophosphatidylcholine acyltransferase/lyso-PAF acetyltransferase
MRIGVVVAAVLASVCFVVLLLSFTDSRDSQVLQAYAQKVLHDVYDTLESRAAVELEKLFTDLDANHDGVLSLHEFQDRRLAVSAAMHAARRELEATLKLPDIHPWEMMASTPRAQVVSFLVAWFQLQLLFVLFFVAYENIMYVFVSSAPRKLKLDDGYLTAQPPKVDIATALKYDTPVGASRYEQLKTAFFVLSGLAFVRIAFFVFFLFSGFFWINMSVLGGRNRRTHPRWFAACEAMTQLCGWFIFVSLGFACIRVYGTPAPRSEAKLLLGTHTCALEVIQLFLQAHMPSFVSRVENLMFPGFRGIVSATNAVVVNRDAADSRTQTLNEIRRRAADADAEQLMVFPEGTCNAQRALFMFRRGSFEPGEPVQLVCFSYPYKHFNMCWSGRSAGGLDLPDLIFRMACQFVNHAEVRYLPVYTPTEAERKDPDAYASHCQAMAAYVVDLPISDASLKDYKAVEALYSQRKSGKNRYTFIDSQARSDDAQHHELAVSNRSTPDTTPRGTPSTGASAQARAAALAAEKPHSD